MLISSRRLPNLDMTIKELVNKGIWRLRKLPKGRYLLITRTNAHLISPTGEILACNVQDRPEYQTYVYFQDLPFPPSLSQL